MPTHSDDPHHDGLPRPGDVVNGKLQIVRVLGEGGMGVVFEGTHLLLERAVAVKFIRPEAMRSAQAQARFLREAKVCAGIRHPNVIDVHDCDTFGRTAYVVMPLLRGESLGQRMEREGALPVDVAARIASQVLDGLHAAHERGVIHRDVKPDNVFLEATADGPRAVVLDFGIAHAVTEDAVDPLTREGAVLGTPRFMSPEQARGDADIDRTTDVYSVGATLYQMLTGAAPFPQTALRAVLVAVQCGHFEPLSARAPAVPPALAQAVTRAMAADRAARFASAQDFAAALRALAPTARAAPTPLAATRPRSRDSRDEVPSAPPVPVVARWSASLALARSRWGITATVTLSVALAAALSFALRAPTTSRAPSRPALPAPAPSTDAAIPAVATVRDAGPAAPSPDASTTEEAPLRAVRVTSEEGAELSAPNTRARAIARPGLPGDNASAVLRVPAGTRVVCCRIPSDERRVCRPIHWDEEGHGDAQCFAD